MKKIIILLTIILTNCSNPSKDYLKIINELETKNQLKLDTGNFMMETEKDFSTQMDSLLMVLINDLNELKIYKTGELQLEQNSWIEKRNLKLNEMWESLSKTEKIKGDFGQDSKMFIYREKVIMTKERIIELNNKLEK